MMEEHKMTWDELAHARAQDRKEIQRLKDDLEVAHRDYTSEHVEKNELQDEVQRLRAALGLAVTSLESLALTDIGKEVLNICKQALEQE